MEPNNVIKRLNAMRKALIDAQYEGAVASTELEDMQYAKDIIGDDSEATATLKEAQEHIEIAAKLCDKAKALAREEDSDAVAVQPGLDASLAAYRRMSRRFIGKQ